MKYFPRSPRQCEIYTQGKLFGGLWGPPMAKGSGTAAAQALSHAHGLGTLSEEAPWARVRHILSHHDLRVEVYRLQARARASARRRRVTPAELKELGTSTMTRKILRVATAPRGTGVDRQVELPYG